MGYYINPENQTKVEWLVKHGTKSLPELSWADVPEGYLPVVLVDNGPFTAAGIAYSEREFMYFTNPDDRRYKLFYLVRIVDLVDVVRDIGGNNLYDEMINLMAKEKK